MNGPFSTPPRTVAGGSPAGRFEHPRDATAAQTRSEHASFVVGNIGPPGSGVRDERPWMRGPPGTFSAMAACGGGARASRTVGMDYRTSAGGQASAIASRLAL